MDFALRLLSPGDEVVSQWRHDFWLTLLQKQPAGPSSASQLCAFMLALGLQHFDGARLCEVSFVTVWDAVTRGTLLDSTWQQLAPVLPGSQRYDDSPAGRAGRLARALVGAYEHRRWPRSQFLRTLHSSRILRMVAAEVHSFLHPSPFIAGIAEDVKTGRLSSSEDQREVINGWSRFWK